MRAFNFDERVERTEGGCWTWTAATYASFGHGCYRGRHAHRYAYERAFGSIPEGMLVLHRCDNPPCVNPDHLFLGTHTDNMRDMVAKGRHANQRKTHCRNGHEYSPDNTRITDGTRYCRACNREAAARCKAKRVAA